MRSHEPAGNASKFEEEKYMPANTPEEICSLFKQYMAEGDLASRSASTILKRFS